MFFDNVTCTAALVFPFLDKSFSHHSQIGKENMFSLTWKNHRKSCLVFTDRYPALKQRDWAQLMCEILIAVLIKGFFSSCLTEEERKNKKTKQNKTGTSLARLAWGYRFNSLCTWGLVDFINVFQYRNILYALKSALLNKFQSNNSFESPTWKWG